MLLKNMRLAAIFFWREWRAGEWYLIYFALFFAVSTLTSLHFYTDRLMQGLEQQSSRLLGGDLALESPTPIPKDFYFKARQLQLKTAEVWLYPTMVSIRNQFQLVNVQAISAKYPLTAPAPLRPSPHTVWLEPRLFPLLNIQVGEILSIGKANFKTDKIPIDYTPLILRQWLLAPRLIMRLEDVPATSTILPGSRAEYRLILQGSKDHLNQFIQLLRPALKVGQRFINASNQQKTLEDFLERTHHFLELAFITCFMMSGVAISISVQQYLRRHSSHVALWSTFGAKRIQIIHLFLWQLFILSLSASILGILVGYAIQVLIEHNLHEILKLSLPSPSLTPFLLALIASLLILMCFAYPILTELPKASPLKLWHQQLNTRNQNSQTYFFGSCLLILLFIYYVVGFSLLMIFILDVLLLSIGLLYLLGLALLSGLRLLKDQTRGTVRQGINQLLHHPESVSVQLTAFSLILTLLLTLFNTQSNLLERWHKRLPPRTPNYFAFNLANTDLVEFRRFFSKADVELGTFYPITRGRLILLNDQSLYSVLPKNALSHNALHRELNLSWMWDFPSDNRITAGRPWSRNDFAQPLISIEASFAKELGLKLEDRLTFQIGDESISAKIMSIRELQWTSFHPNFYVIFPPGVLNHFATTYLVSFYLNPSHNYLINTIVRSFPNVTVIDIAFLLKQLQNILEKLTLTFQYLFLFTFGSAILIFMASFQASMDERRKTYHLLRILGANRNYLYKSILVEFLILASLVIAISLLLSEGLSYLLVKSLI